MVSATAPPQASRAPPVSTVPTDFRCLGPPANGPFTSLPPLGNVTGHVVAIDAGTTGIRALVVDETAA